MKPAEIWCVHPTSRASIQACEPKTWGLSVLFGGDGVLPLLLLATSLGPLLINYFPLHCLCSDAPSTGDSALADPAPHMSLWLPPPP